MIEFDLMLTYFGIIKRLELMYEKKYFYSGYYSGLQREQIYITTINSNSIMPQKSTETFPGTFEFCRMSKKL
ncbi:hypothetical protein DXA68_13565 [Bacteroides stercorirosoris]|uniref:Uncharacterized protein n=2 Tax=Bacteroides stercorirosoris TaxID=871324 RepID=A0A413H337_9BACE|nr:hypothetical protein DXA68_13565 [Bacteroides stercorirosoris]